MKGPLEADVLEASEACWTMDERNVQVKRAVTRGCSGCPAYTCSILCSQVKSKLLVSFRARQVKAFVPEFIAEAEQQLLGAALKQWHSSAEGVVASSILEVRVAEQRLLHAVYRYVLHFYVPGVLLLCVLINARHLCSIAAGWCSRQALLEMSCWNCLTACSQLLQSSTMLLLYDAPQHIRQSEG